MCCSCCASRCTELIKVIVCISVCVVSVGVASKLQCGLNSFCLSTCCHQAKQSSFPTASPLGWLIAFCQPSSLVSTSVSTPLFFQSLMFSSFLLLPLYFCLTPLSPSLPPLWWYMLLSPWNTGSEPNKPSLLMATSSVLGTLLDNPSTTVYRPIGALVCKAHKGRVAQLSNMAPFYLWSLYLLSLAGSWTWWHAMST